ncbi:MAG: terminase small subunit [Proteobacteria bacterium]|nr:terminase small subunit [Pseudomonadota bacterium]
MPSDTQPNPTPGSPPEPQETGTGKARTGNQQIEPLPPRQEAFCHYFVLWGNASVAAKQAGYARASARNQGYRQGRRPRIRARIAALRRGLARAYGLDAEVLVGKLEALYQRAVDDHHFHAAARCVELQARMAGHVEGRFKVAAVESQGERTGERTTNDDIHGPFAAPKQAQSTG